LGQAKKYYGMFTGKIKLMAVARTLFMRRKDTVILVDIYVEETLLLKIFFSMDIEHYG
jgi:hypothetical protein